MALSKNKKNEVVNEVSELLSTSKMTVVAKYEGTGVKTLQALRKSAKENGTKIKVVKNRLVKQAISSQDNLKDLDLNALQGMLLYAFNPEDEVAPAQVINSFIKTNPSLEFIGAISADGDFIDAAGVKQLASLPSREQLLAGIINTLNSPLNNVISAIGKLPNVIQSLEASAK